jgi:hypothetical protein
MGVFEVFFGVFGVEIGGNGQVLDVVCAELGLGDPRGEQ